MTIAQVSEKFDLSQDTLRYYEKIGMIPPVKRTSGGIRNYDDEDFNWISLAKCMRSAGLSVETVVEYRKLYEMGDDTINERYKLLSNQREVLLKQRESIDEMLNRLNYKISRYEIAVETGVLSWDDNENCTK